MEKQVLQKPIQATKKVTSKLTKERILDEKSIIGGSLSNSMEIVDLLTKEHY